MMNLMVDGVKKEGLQPARTADEPEQESKCAGRTDKGKPAVKEKKPNQKGNRSRLRKYLFQKVETNARGGKTVYIRQEFHEKLTRIIQVIGEDKIPFMLIWITCWIIIFRNLANRLPRAITKSINPFNNLSYGNCNCNMPADSHCLAFAG
jgi:hypothetical protein